MNSYTCDGLIELSLVFDMQAICPLHVNIQIYGTVELFKIWISLNELTEY